MNRAQELAGNLTAVQDRLGRACAAAGRLRAQVTLVAVTKTWPATDVALLAELGVRHVGESKDAEAAAKAAEVPGMTWHFVGRLQTNKARSVATYADVVHSVDRARLVRALSEGAQRAGRRVDALLQISLDGDPARAGATVDDVPALADLVAGSPGVRLAGVMAVAPLRADPRSSYDRLLAVSADLRTAHPDATAVSAGMSGDLEAAVAAGATYVRIGTALLGHRPPLVR